MIFSIVIVVLIAAVAYFHYTQGLFSATLSAICAALAAVLALSYHEVIIFSFLKGKVADYAHGMILVALFALIYTILRMIFDSLVPGNLRFPTTVDKAGAGAMGLVAALFATGIFAIAAQMLPFGASVGGYSRYKTSASVDVQVPTQRQAEDSYSYDVLSGQEPGKFEPEDASGLLIPVDDMVINITSKLSRGALSGSRSVESVHPEWLNELFAQRLGVQVGANRVAYNVPGTEQVSVPAVFTIDQLATADAEIPQIRQGVPMKNVPEVLKPTPDKIILIVRTMFGRGADDSDHNVRFSPATVRLYASGKNYYPLGTLDNQQVFLRANRLDDFVVVAAEKGADLVFLVDRTDLGLPQGGRRGEASEMQIGDGVFLEAKRMGAVDLSGKQIQSPVVFAENVGPFRKRNLPVPKSIPAAAPSLAQPSEAPLSDIKAEVNAKLFTDVNVGDSAENTPITFASGTATLKEGKFAKLTVNTTQTLQLLRQGGYVVSEFAIPPGMRMVQVSGKPVAEGAFDAWSWSGNLAEFELIDSNGGKHVPSGAWAKVAGAQGSQRMVANFDSTTPARDVAQEEGRPTDVWIAFLVPENTKLTELKFRQKTVQALDLEVK